MEKYLARMKVKDGQWTSSSQHQVPRWRNVKRNVLRRPVTASRRLYPLQNRLKIGLEPHSHRATNWTGVATRETVPRYAARTACVLFWYPVTDIPLQGIISALQRRQDISYRFASKFMKKYFTLATVVQDCRFTVQSYIKETSGCQWKKFKLEWTHFQFLYQISSSTRPDCEA